MDLSKLSSKEFQEDFENVIKKINKEHNLSLHCGLISYGDYQLTITLENVPTTKER